MFFAIFNIYANNYLNIDRTKQIKDWVEFNSNTINSNGFWGKSLYGLLTISKWISSI